MHHRSEPETVTESDILCHLRFVKCALTPSPLELILYCVLIFVDNQPGSICLQHGVLSGVCPFKAEDEKE